jgi:hypothetical protein
MRNELLNFQIPICRSKVMLLLIESKILLIKGTPLAIETRALDIAPIERNCRGSVLTRGVL